MSPRAPFRWQAALRAVVAIAGISFAVLLYLRFDRKPPSTKAAIPPPLAPGMSFQSTMKPGEVQRQCRYENGKETSCLSYSSFQEFDDGRRVLEKPVFQGDRGGKPYTVSANRGELKTNAADSDPNKIPDTTHFIGDVVMKETGGMEIHTADATYLESTTTLEIPGAMTFANGRMSGSGVGATYVKNEDRLELRDQAAVNMAPDDKGEGKLAGRAHAMRLNRITHELAMDGGATLERDTDVLKALGMKMRLTDDNQGVQQIEMRTQSSITPIGAAKTPEMHGDDINLAFQADGRTIQNSQMLKHASLSLSGTEGRRQIIGDTVSVRLAADGQTAIGLTGVGAPLVEVNLPATADTPKRTIRGKSMDGSGSEKAGLNAVVFDRSVEFIESSPAARGKAAVDRRVTAQRLVLTLNAGDLSDIKDARFTTGVQFADGQTHGTADDVTYVAKDSRLLLRQAAKATALSRVVAERIEVNAKSIDVDLNKTKIHAVGAVDSTTTPDKSAVSKGLFDETKPVRGRANDLSYDDELNQATYSGGAQLFQGSGKDLNLVKGDTIKVDDQAGNLTATGNVQTQLAMDNMQTDGAAPRASADSLDYKDADHRALYTGSEKTPAEFNGPDGKVKGVTIELITAADSHDLKTMIATVNVVARVAADQTARGARLNYDAKAGKYVLDGTPAHLIKREVTGGVESCSEQAGNSLVYTKASDGSGKGTIAAGQNGSGQTSGKLASCETWIIK